MPDALDVIIVDDDPMVCEIMSEIVKRFYVWGEVRSFTNATKAISYCKNKRTGVAIFVLDVFLENRTCFDFLDVIIDKFPMAYEDTVVVTGNASDDIVNMCIASNISYLIEKPIKAYTLQLAVRAIVAKYIRFAKRLLRDPDLASSVDGF